MNISKTCIQILDQLASLVGQIDEKDFVRPGDVLSGSTIGQHLRHTLEFFICLEGGYECGRVNYDKRCHDKVIENDKFVALSKINAIRKFVEESGKNKTLVLEVGYDLASDNVAAIETNFVRELVYNIEHAVHHMAIIKIGIREVAPYVKLPKDFGVAASTIRHKQTEETTHS